MPRKKKKKSPKLPSLSFNLAPAVSREVIAVILALLALLLTFAVFGFGGMLVTSLFGLLRQLVGYTAFMLPAAAGVFAYMLFKPASYEVKPRMVFGLGALIVSLSGLLHVFVEPGLSVVTAEQGKGGGFTGSMVAGIMLPLLNPIAAALVLLASVIITTAVTINAPVSELMGRIFGGLKRNKAAEPELKVNEAIPSTPSGDPKVNDPANFLGLPIRGKLNVGNKKAAAPAAPAKKEEPQEALTSSLDPNWKTPELTLLEKTGSKADAGNVKENARIIGETMESFGIAVQMGEVNVGPTVTQYTFMPPSGVKLNKITTLDTNLALSLAAHPIRIEAPIPGKSAVGVEIPNKSIAMVRLRNMLEDPAWAVEKNPLTFVLGRDVSGSPMYANLQKMPHMLIAGATGSGKSAMINSFLTSLLYRNSPSQMKLILVDPKKVELGLYDKIPHLLAPVINDPEKTVSALKWAVAEMDRRYDLLKEVGNRNIDEYNSAIQKRIDERQKKINAGQKITDTEEDKYELLPFIVVVIDEMADLMMLAGKEVEGLIVRLAQMARAIGIHLVLATQRPSVDVITGVIKANVPARLAFSVASQVDSRTILDQMGAEKLLGKGDMLFASPDMMKPRRIQGAFLEEKEVKAVTDFLRTQMPEDFEYNDEVLAQKVSLGGGRAGGGGGGDYDDADDDLFEDAAEAVIQAGKASTSMLQRRLRVGYARAARLVDLLEERNVVGPADGARPRDVLVSSLDEVRQRVGSGGYDE